MSRVLGRTPAFLLCSLVLLFVSAFASGGAHATLGTCDSAGPIEVETGGPFTQYATLGAAFTAINAGTHTGAITIEVCANSAETGATVLNSSGAGAASYTSITIRPLIDGAIISGATVTGRGLIELNGADNVTIDGDNPNTAGTNQNLFLTNTAANTVTFTSVVRIALSTLITSANNDTVKNCVITGSASGRNVAAASSTTGSENTTYGILVGGGASTVSATTAPTAISSVTTTIAAGQTATSFTTDRNLIDSCARGIAVMGAATTVANLLSITNNTIGNASSASTTTVYSRGMTLQGFDNTTISGNTIRNINWFVGSGSFQPTGISFGFESASGTNAVVDKNNITGVNNRNTGTFGAYGINIAAGTNITLRNNFVSGVTGDMTGGVAFSTTNGLFGIRVGGGTGHKVYHNSVNLFGLRSGTGTSSLLSAALGIVATTQTGCDVRNNILSNTMTGGTTSIAYVSAFLPSGGTAAMTLIWNNNAYFSGTDARQGIAQVGTTPGTTFFLASNFNSLATTPSSNFRSYTSTLGNATNDNASFATTSAAPFTSSTDLHIPAATATQLESGGANIGVATDIDGDARSATPDIGADEFAGVAVDLTPPAITYTAFGNTTATTNRTLSITVTDLNGVPTSGVGLPVIYFRKGTSGAYANTQCSFVSGSAYNCVIDYGLVTGGSVTTGDTVQYYVAAQDNNNNVTTNPSAGASGFTANPPAASTPPTTPNSYLIAVALSGAKTVCASGCDYTTLTGATGAFNAVNTSVVTGNVDLQIAGDLVAGETGAVGLNPIVEEPSGSNFTLRIYPTGAPRTITSTTAPAAGFIRLNAADRVTIDGSLDGTGTNRNLTVSTVATGTAVGVIWLQSNGADGATNNTIKNVNVVGNSNSTTLAGIGSGSSTVTGLATAPNSNNVYQNNSVQKTQFGIVSFGVSAAVKNSGTVVTQNVMTGTLTNSISIGAIWAQFENGIQITDNRIDGMSSALSADVFGITAGFTGYSSTTFTGNEVTNASILRNFIGQVIQTNTFSAVGIGVASASSGTTLIANNSIYGVGANGTSPDFGAGIYLGGGAGSTTEVYFNSVSMTGTFTGGALPNFALAIGGSDPVVDVKDNALYNTITNGTGASASIGTAATTFVNLTSNYNDLSGSGTAYRVGRTGGLGVTATDRTTLANWQTATSNDANSISANPLFNSLTNLQPQTGSPLVGAGTPLSVLTDILGVTRSLSTPTIGAYENALDTAGPAITYTALTNTTSTSNRTLTISVTDPSGVPTSGLGLPVLYYRKGLAGAYASSQCIFTSGSSYDCLIDYSAVTGGDVAPGDTIQYFVAAQDNLNNVSTNPAGGTGLTANPPAAGTAPAPNSYVISFSYNGTKSICASSCDYTGLTTTGGVFAAINAGVLNGDLTLEIAGDLAAETGAVALNQWAEEGVGNYTLTIKPVGSPRVISGASAASSGLITLNGADRVTIDGAVSGLNQDLTITNTTTTGVVIWIRSASASNGASSNTVKNVRLFGAGTASGGMTVAGVMAGSSTFGNPADAPNSNNKIQNCLINHVQNGAFLSGNATLPDLNWEVSGNTFGSANAADKLSFRGMLLGGAQSFTITRNTILGVLSSTATSSTMSGIQVSANIVGGSITYNKITDIKQVNTTGWGSNGLLLSASTTASDILIANNFISDVASQGFNDVGVADNGYGIVVASGGGYKIYNNSVHLNTNQVATGGNTAELNVLAAVTTAGAVDLRNNVFVSSQTVGTRWAVLNAAANNVFSTINYNDYFAQNVGRLGTTTHATLAAWQGATGQDANSKSVNPNFVSATDLHLNTTGGPSPVENSGVSIAAVTDDIDGDLRGSVPEMGADEVQACLAVACGGYDTACGVASCDPTGLSGNCNTVTPVTDGRECRVAASPECDVAEFCDGSNILCPADVVAPATTECRASAGVCDVAESCTGLSGVCPADGFVSGGTECRASDGICDVAESCTGSAAACPADAFQPSTVECRASDGICDVAESCTGSAAACPADAFQPSTVECRASDGICDVAEICTGSAAACPADAFQPSTVECRASDGVCDVAESCTGSAAACPADAFQPSTVECRASDGVCDVAESCTGSAAACPADAFEPSTTVCRGSEGICDVAESCTGSAAACPADAFQPSTFECRASDGVCDVAESCTGSAAACPADAFQPSTFECRAADGVCDVAESCTGSAAACPADAFQPSTVECRASDGVCDVAESCTGSAAACPADAFEPSTTVCRGSEGICDVAESCTGSAAACPADAFQPSTVECRASDGVCDVAESCTGSAAACPADAFVDAGTECRPAGGTCDYPEACTGFSAACPDDVVVAAGTECRPSSGETCDPAEACDGVTPECPKDAVDQSAALGATVALSKVGGTTISWTEVEPGPFNVYRGAGGPGLPWSYNQGCMAEGVPGSSTTDTAVPASGQFFYYLISRTTDPCDESTLGEDSSGSDRPNLYPCPNPGPDTDADTVLDVYDNCRTVSNVAQADVDADGHGDACDNCPLVANPDQANADADASGDVCDPDNDNDGVPNGSDNCPFLANPSQLDVDLDNVGDCCDPDFGGVCTP